MLDKTSFLSRFGEIVGARYVTAEPADMQPYLVEDRGLYHGRAFCVVRPGNVNEVSRVVALCDETNTKIVPQGGNTGLVGGQIPHESGDEIVLSLTRLTAIREVDVSSNTMIVEAGVTLLRAQEEAENVDRLFPLSLASEGSCTIGGNLSTNAGGTAVLAYGNARDLVLGLEVVLADGRVLPALSALRKDNTGYDVRGLFLGAEGTLGVITAASLRLFPKIRARATALAAVPEVRAAVELLGRLRDASSDRVSSFELIPRIGIELTTRHIPGVSDPLDRSYPWYLLCELGASRAADPLAALLEEALGGAVSAGVVLDAGVARSERE